jgi:hypothetical protein
VVVVAGFWNPGVSTAKIELMVRAVDEMDRLMRATKALKAST